MQIPLYSALQRIGVTDEEAEKVTQAVSETMECKVTMALDAVRADIAVMRGEMMAFQARVEAELAKFDNRLMTFQKKTETEFARVDSKIDHKIDSIRWMIGVLVPVCSILVTAMPALIAHFK